MSKESIKVFMKKIVHWIPAFLYMALIFYMSSRPVPDVARAAPIYFDVKLIHIVEYWFLSALLFYALDKTTKTPLAWKMIYAVALAYIYGLTDEFHQIFVAGRSASLADAFANLVGACIFQAGIFSHYKRNRKKF